MAFATGHTPRSGFVAGQLRDGDSFGTVAAIFGGQNVLFKFDIRYYNKTLVVLGSKLTADGKTELEKPAVVSASWATGVYNAALPNDVKALKDLISMMPSASTLASIGVKDAQVMPTYPTGDLIPYEQNADGFIKAYVSAADQAKAATDAQKQQTNLLTQLTSAVTGTNNTPGTTTGTSGGSAAGMSMTVKIVIGVVVAVVVGGIIYMATKKKKKGGK